MTPLYDVSCVGSITFYVFQNNSNLLYGSIKTNHIYNFQMLCVCINGMVSCAETTLTVIMVCIIVSNRGKYD